MSGAPLYLDYNSTTPPAREVVAAVVDGLERAWGNPSSAHGYGKAARQVLRSARTVMARLLGAEADSEVVFTSGGTEAINWVVRGVAEEAGAAGGVLVSSAVEHPAVERACAAAAAGGGEGRVRSVQVAVDGAGSVDLAALGRILASEDSVLLVSVMGVQNEVGTVQPLEEVASLVQAYNARRAGKRAARVLCDASQAVGKLPNAALQGLVRASDFVVVAAHKFYGPKGVGALWVRGGVPASPPALLRGAGQEEGRRAGTENVALIAGMAAAAERVLLRGADAYAAQWAVRRAFVSRLRSELGAAEEGGGLRVNGSSEEGRCAANTVSVSFAGCVGPHLVTDLAPELAVSSGAACHAGDVTPSRVLLAMGVDRAWASGTLRVSFGWDSTLADADFAARAIARVVRTHRARSLPTTSLGELPAAQAPTGVGGGAGDAAAAPAAGSAAGSAAGAEAAPAPLSTEPLYFASGRTADLDGATRVLACWRAADAPVPAVDGCGWVLVLDRSVFHPQGGGQPSDVGVVRCSLGEGRATQFVVAAARKGPKGSALERAVLLFGGGWRDAAAPGDESHEVAVVRAANALDPSAPRAGLDGLGDGLEGSEAVVGRTVVAAVHSEWRQLARRLHSAGHLLDLAMRRAGLTPEAGVVPGKGYHFRDGPWVEYEGAIPADRVEALPEQLSRICAEVIAENVPTRVVEAAPSDLDTLQAHGIPSSATDGLPPDAPVRFVAVAAPDNWCPCGGTHVDAPADIRAIRVTRIKSKKGLTKVSYEVTA